MQVSHVKLIFFLISAMPINLKFSQRCCRR